MVHRFYTIAMPDDASNILYRVGFSYVVKDTTSDVQYVIHIVINFLYRDMI